MVTCWYEVMLHRAVISACNMRTVETCAITVLLDIICCAITSIVLPLAIKSNELSEYLICLWKTQLTTINEDSGNALLNLNDPQTFITQLKSMKRVKST